MCGGGYEYVSVCVWGGGLCECVCVFVGGGVSLSVCGGSVHVRGVCE